MASKDLSVVTKKNCAGCKKGVVNGVLCPVCEAQFHKSCADNTGILPSGGYTKCCRPASPLTLSPSTSDSPLTVSDLERIIGGAVTSLKSQISEVSSALSTKIDNVSAIMDNRMTEAETKIVDLSDRVSTIEGTLKSLPISDSNFFNNVSQDCLSEIENRLFKKKNIILFGVPELINFHEKSPKESENLNLHVSNLLKNLLPADLLTNTRMLRVGIPSQTQQRPRPLKVVFESEEKAQTFQRAFLQVKKTSSQEVLKGLWLTMDKTKAQLDVIKTLKNQMEVRRLNGEQNLQLTFRGGHPRIVKAVPNTTSVARVT